MKFKKYKFAALASHMSVGGLSFISGFCYRTRANFYWQLAGLLCIGLLISSLLGLSLFGAEQNTFDTLIKMRWSSPVASKDIVILDVDEKSLSKLAPTLGRWPWKREVMAEVLSEIESAGAKSIIFNILITDPDIGNLQSDAVLNDIASGSKLIAFPLVRLPKENDLKSSLHVSALSGAVLKVKTDDPTIAVIMPGMAGMHKSIGISNLEADPDGILRQYSINRVEDKWSMPSLVGRVLGLAGIATPVSTDSPYSLNWRNKKGGYQRISFVDYLDTLEGKGNLPSDSFVGKHVILGASAAGISSLKATSASPLTDDNEILATALDDAINGTNLKPLPSWIITILAISFIGFLAFMYDTGKASEETDIIFVAIEGLSIVIMFLAMSYTNQFIDMSPIATYGLIFFSVAKIHQGFANKVIKGSPSHISFSNNKQLKLLAILAFEKEKYSQTHLKKHYEKLVSTFGSQSVFLCLDVFEDGTMFSSLKDVGCLVVLDIIEDANEFATKINLALEKNEDNFAFEIYPMPRQFENNNKMLEYISQKILIEVSKKVS